MKVTQLAIIGVAFVAAGGAAMIASNMTAPVKVAPVAVEQAGPKLDLVEVLVASNEISLGTSVNDSMVEWKQWPKEGVSEGFIVREDEAVDFKEDPQIARASFFSGEPIRRSKLISSANGFMSAILPTGQRAIATSISTTTSAGGFILPNDRVDVLMTRQDGKAASNGAYTSETVLENVRVLAIDQTIEEKDGKSVVVGETATLQLSPKQTQILTVAQQMAARLTLVLRSVEDIGDEVTTGADHLLRQSDQRDRGTVALIKAGKRQDIDAAQNQANMNSTAEDENH